MSNPTSLDRPKVVGRGESPRYGKDYFRIASYSNEKSTVRHKQRIGERRRKSIVSVSRTDDDDDE